MALSLFVLCCLALHHALHPLCLCPLLLSSLPFLPSAMSVFIPPSPSPSLSPSLPRFWFRGELRTGSVAARGAGASGVGPERGRPLAAVGAQRLPAVPSARAQYRPAHVHASEPGPLRGGQLRVTGAAHGDQPQRRPRQPEGVDTHTHTRKHTHTYGICITHTTLTEDKEGREHSSIVEQLSGFHGSETTGPGTVL